MIWKIPKIWQDGTVWIIGGGPSIPKQFGVPQSVITRVLNNNLSPGAYSKYLEPLHNRHVIGVNSAFLLGDWIDLVVFGDKTWYNDNSTRLLKFPGLKVGCHGHIDSNRGRMEGIKFMARDKQITWGISDKPGYIGWNGNTGAVAINIAIHAGAKRIILLGFDMKLDEDNKQHWHSLYKTANRKDFRRRSLPFDRHMRAFGPINRMARQRGVEIINANPDSAIEEFKKIPLEELL